MLWGGSDEKIIVAEKLSKHCWSTPKCGISTAERHFRFSKPVNYVFIIVRNPYHRMVSFYNNKIIYAGVSPYELDRQTYEKPVVIPHLNAGNTHMSFRQFIELVGKIEVLLADRHLLPQYAGVESMKFDYVVRCESYAKDVKSVCDVLELDYEKYAKLNVNHFPRTDISDFAADQPALWFHEHGIPRRYDVFYDDALEEIVWNQYQKDFELFGYERRDI